MRTMDALKKTFRQGHHAQAIAECEARCLREPANHEVKRLCATMHGMLHNYARALDLLQQIRNPRHENADILFNIAVCERELKNFGGAQQHFKRFTEMFPDSPDGWGSLAESEFQLGLSRALGVVILLLLAGCSGIAPRQSAGSPCLASEASYACQLERYRNVNVP